MAIARDDLRLGHRSISQIAFAIGFRSASAFTTAFTRRTGQSPRAFARTHSP
jgi:AraC-like DNA-binding protein